MNKGRAISKLKSMLYVCSGATAVFSGLSIYQGNEQFYENVLLPVVHQLDPEVSHNLAILVNKYNVLPKSTYNDPVALVRKIIRTIFRPGYYLEQRLQSLSAGLDKDAEAFQGLLYSTGFGFVEVGSVTPLPQPGNPRPRVFRLADNHAIINRYGFNSCGHLGVMKRLENRQRGCGVVGVNLGKNRDSDDPVQDYVKGITLLGPLADYLVINISSPNTPGLRSWQRKEQLGVLLKAVVAARDALPPPHKPPLLLKLSPDLTEEERKDIGSIVMQPQCRVDGLIISNTSTERSPSLVGPHVDEEGGLSGKPLFSKSTAIISDMYALTKGELPIIGVGGVFTGKDAYDKIRAGASLVQLYTSFIYHGPPRITKIKKELHDLLEADGYKSVSEAVGKDVKL